MADANTARNVYDDPEFSREDLAEVAGGKKGAREIFEESDNFVRRAVNIRERIQQANGVLSEKEQEKYLRKLSWLERKRDPEALRILDEETKKVIDEVARLTREYFSKLDVNKELFGLDTARKVDTLQEYKDEFLKQEIEGKEKYAEALPDELKSLQDLRNRLIKLVGDSKTHMEEFGKLRRHEKHNDYLPKLEQNMRQFNDLIKKLESSGEYHKSELETMKVRFNESPLRDQEALLKEWGVEGKTSAETGEAASSLTELRTDFGKFSRERQLKYEKMFADAKTKKAKMELITKMRDELKNEYMGKVNQSKYLSPGEKKSAAESVAQSNFDIEFIELCLSTFDQCEKRVKEFAATYESQPPEAKSHYDFWNADYNKKKKIAEAIKEHGRLIAEFEKKAKKMVEEGLVARESVEGENGYIVKFKKLNLKDKKEKINHSPLDWPIRKEVLSHFKTLPAEYQKRMKDAFFKAHLKDRMRMLMEAKREIDETAKYREKFAVKVRRLGKGKLIAQKTVAAYEAWIKKLSLTDLKRFYEKSELNDPLREKALKSFESLDNKTKKQNAHFYELDLNARMALLKKLNPEEAQRITEEAESERAAESKVIDFEKRVKIKTLRESADKFKGEGNTDAERIIHEQILTIDPNNKISQKRLKEIAIQQNPMMQILNEDLANNPTMRRKMEGLEIIEIFEDMMRQSELAEGGKKLKNRSSKFGNAKWGNLHKALFEYTGGEKILDEETGMAIEVERLDIDKMQEGSDTNLLERYVRLFREERPDTGKNTKKFRKYTTIKRDGRELDTNELQQEKARFIENFVMEASRGAKKPPQGIKKPENARKTLKKNAGSRLRHIIPD